MIWLFASLASTLLSLAMSSTKSTTFPLWLYCDLGAGPKCIENTIFSCNKLLSPNYTVECVYAKDIIDRLPQLEGNDVPKLIIFPGGADKPYHSKLKGTGCANIRSYVENGGNYLGLCAGGYFGTNQIFFKFGSTLWSAQRELSFHDDLKCSGPILAAYDAENNKGLEAALIRVPMLKGQEFNVYYHGGGHFYFENNGKNEVMHPNWTVLATYSKNQHPECDDYVDNFLNVDCPSTKSGDVCDDGLIAMIHGVFGKGNVILTGVHPEIDPALFRAEDIKSTPVLEILKEPRNVNLRSRLLQRMFSIFGLQTERLPKL